jgi:DNA-binding NtrC family response regulator
MPMSEALDASKWFNTEVMIVDDEDDIRDLLGDHLHELGLNVTTMPNGRAAVDALEHSNGRFGIVLTDINMPEADGYEVVSAARKANAAADIVVITGYGSTAAAARVASLGALEYLPKPFKLGQLDTILHSICDRRASAAAH